jgi:hypothetical protein
MGLCHHSHFLAPFQNICGMNQPPAAKSSLRGSTCGLVFTGAIAVLIADVLPWLEGNNPQNGPVSGPFAVSLVFVPDGKTVAVAAGLAGLIGVALFLRRFVLVAGIAVLVLAAITGRIAAVDFLDLRQYVAKVPLVFDFRIGPGLYIAAIGIVVWALGGLIAVEGGLKNTDTITALSRFGRISALWLSGISTRRKRAIALIALAATSGVVAGTSFLTTPAAVLGALCGTACETITQAQSLESLTPVAEAWSAIQTQRCEQEYLTVQDGLRAYMAYYKVDSVPAAGPVNNMTSPVRLYNSAGTPSFVPNSTTIYGYGWDGTGRIDMIAPLEGGPDIPPGCFPNTVD